MKVTFRQGIVSHQQNFLYFEDTDVLISTTNKPTIVTVSHGQTDYLIIEPTQSPKKLWMNLPQTSSCWIYWDINLVTAAKTYGFTESLPIYSNVAPQTPVTDQHWFNTISNKMFVWSGSNWVEKIRVFAAKVDFATIIIPYQAGHSQSGVYGSFSSGVILFDQSGTSIKKQNGNFLTTEDSMLIDSSVTYTAKIEAYSSYGFANESIPAFSVTKSLPDNRFGLAEYEDTTDEILSFVTSSHTFDQPISVVYEGIITNPEWDWVTGSKIWVDRFGQLTTGDPGISNVLRGQQPPVARAITSDSILFSPNGGMGTITTGSGQPINIEKASETDEGVVFLSVDPTNNLFPIAVGTNDPRMTDARTPLAHNHDAIDVTISPIVGVTASDVQTALQFIESQYLAHVSSPYHLTPAQQTLINGITVTASQINSLAGISSNIQTQVDNKQPLLGYVPVNKAGDSMSGHLNLPGNPTTSSHAVTKQYVDSSVSLTGGFLAAPVQDITALTSYLSVVIPDKQIRLVEDEGAIYRYDSQSSELPNGTTVVIPTDSPPLGRWIKIQSTSADHGSLSGIQGGSVGDYYHITLSEKTSYDDHISDSDIHVTATEKNLLTGLQVSQVELNNLVGTTGPIQTQLDSKQPLLGYTPVNKAGDSMSGFLTLSGNPINTLHASTKSYVDTQVATRSLTSHNHDTNYVSLSGATMVGTLTLSGAPTSNLHAATKQYVDDVVVSVSQTITDGNGLVKTGNQMDVVGSVGRIVANANNIDLVPVGTAGTYGLVTTDAYGRVISGSTVPAQTITLSGDVYGSGTSNITTSLTNSGVVAGTYSQVTVNSKGIVTSGSSVTISPANLPVDGYASTYVNVSGDTMTGSLTLNGAPTALLHATTKSYVDTGLATKSNTTHNHDSSYVNITGSSMTGALTLSGAPTANSHATTKSYVDSKSRYDIASGTIGKPAVSDTILRFVVVVPFNFGINLINSRAVAVTGSTASSVFSLRKNGVQFATLTYSGTAGTFSGPLTSFVAGDIFTIVAPGTQDTTLSDLTYTLVGTLT